MTDRHRFFLHGRRPYAHNLGTEIAERLHCQEAAITIHFHDGLYRLDLHGDPCSDCALVLELPRPDSGDAFLSARRDVCTLLDLRPLGAAAFLALPLPCFAHTECARAPRYQVA